MTRHLADKWLREAEGLAGLEPLRGSLWHAYRRKWATERKHLPDVDAPADIALGEAKAEDDRIDELEMVVATLKVANDLERVGDHAVNIAKAVRRLAEAPAFPAVREVLEMAEIRAGWWATRSPRS
jgi:hypothetical protein